MAAHPNIKHTWLEWEMKNGNPELILVIETDLEIRPHTRSFDSGALDDMVQNAIDGQAEINVVVERVRIVPFGTRSG